MNKEFKALFDNVDKLKKLVLELDAALEERAELRTKLKSDFRATVKKYYDAEEQLNERIRRSNEENEKNKEKIKELTKQEIQAEMQGNAFDDKQTLELLKAEVNAHPLKIEAIEALRNEVVISDEEQRFISSMQAEETKKSARIRTMQDNISLLVGQIKAENCLYCLSCFENIPGNNHFMQEEFNELSSLRMEAQKW